MTMRSRRHEAGLVAAVILLLVLSYTLFSEPALSCVYDPNDMAVMKLLALTPMEDACPDEIVYQYRMERFDFASVLSLGQPSIVLAAALARLVSMPFGAVLDVRVLAGVYMLVMALGAYLAVSGLYGRTRTAAIAVGLTLVCLAAHSTLMTNLVSLNQTGTTMAMTVFFLGALIHTLCQRPGCGARHAMLVMLAGMLLLCAQAQLVVLWPAVLLCVAASVWHTCPKGDGRKNHVLICLAALILCANGFFTYGVPAREEEAAENYLAVFQGYAAYGDTMQVLDDFGLDASFAADVGKSYYEDPASFAHAPGDANANMWLGRLTLEKRLRYCKSHPETVRAIIDQKFTYLYDAFNGSQTAADGEARYVRPSVYMLLQLVLGEGGYTPTIWRMLGCALLCLLLVLVTSGGTRLLCAALAALLANMAMVLPFGVAWSGGIDMNMLKELFLFFGWLGVLLGVAALLVMGQRVFTWLADAKMKLRPAPMERASAREITLPHMEITVGGMTAVCVCACVALTCWLLLPQSHVAGVNNGDFGRMMEQLDLYWTDDLLLNSEDQLAARAIEEYTYREPYHAKRLTSLDPTYSLVFPAFAARIWSGMTNQAFSTRMLAIVLLMLTGASVVMMMRDLYPLLGQCAAVLGLCLTVMLFGENYVAWYNSLFGEACISTGLMMTCACAVHLAMMKRGDKRSLLWLVLLGLSVRFLCCAKAQMLLALPFGLLLLGALAMYHHSAQRRRMLAMALAVTLTAGIAVWDTVGVYRKNAEVSEKQTVWQSIFYGALMVTDEPEKALADLGLDPVLKADIGKHAYYPDSEYVYPPMSPLAQERIYSKVSTMTMVGYYLTHPGDLLKMLDHAAKESVQLHTGFMTYTDQRYDDYQGLYRFNVWRYIRPFTACRAFWQYVVLYGGVILLCISKMRSGRTPDRSRLLMLIILCVMGIGVMQYPLSVIGNGFADNNKQMYGFMLCHDLLVITGITLLVRWMLRAAGRRQKKESDEPADNEKIAVLKDWPPVAANPNKEFESAEQAADERGCTS